MGQGKTLGFFSHVRGLFITECNIYEWNRVWSGYEVFTSPGVQNESFHCILIQIWFPHQVALVRPLQRCRLLYNVDRLLSDSNKEEEELFYVNVLETRTMSAWGHGHTRVNVFKCFIMSAQSYLPAIRKIEDKDKQESL